MVFSCASVLLMQSVFAAGSTLLPISGTTRIDEDASDGITGSTVVIQNTGNASQSTGDLGALLPRSGLFSQMPEIEDNGKLDFAMPVEPIPEMLAAPFALSLGIPPAVGDDKMFVITNPITYVSTNESFKLLKDGSNCLIWAKDSKITTGMAESIAIEFDNSYSTLKSNFGEFLGADAGNKVNVLLYDIQDGNNPSGYIAGFFYAADFYNANKAPIIHIDTYPAMYRSTTSPPRVSNAYSTIVHEMQHLINYSNSYRKSVPTMDSWLNEALSMAAEEMIYPNSSIPSRLWSYNTDYSSSITNGKSLLSFDNSLESYALSCLFSAYLKSQTDSTVFSRIISNYNGNVADAITNALTSSVLNGFTFNDVLSAYKIALARNDQTGIYGFNSDAALAGINPHIYSGGSMLLPPGGSITVIPASGTFIPSGNGPDIKFMGISEFTGAPVITNKPIDMVVGETYTLTGTGDAPLTWSSSDALVATVDSSGMITALAEGNTTITLSNDLSSDTFVLTVKGKSISIKPFVTTIMIGSSVTLEAITRPSGGAVTWSSLDAGVATIGASDGALTAYAEGTTTVTATCDGLTASVEVKVIPAATYPGLVIDKDNKVMDVVSDIGMHTLSGIMANYNSDFDRYLESWTVNLKTPVVLTDFLTIGRGLGAGGTPFKGTFNGNNNLITVESFKQNNLNDIGIFMLNDGVINDINVLLTKVLDVSNAPILSSCVVNRNNGILNNPTIVVADTGGAYGGTTDSTSQVFFTLIASYNYGTINNASATNHGSVTGVTCFAGVAHENLGVINGFTFYNDGHIECKAHITGGVADNGNGGQGWVTGDINVIFGESGFVKATASFGSSGAVVAANFNRDVHQGHVGNRNAGDNTKIYVRIDGEFLAPSGEAAGVISTGGFNVPVDQMPFVSVTVGPKGKIEQRNGESGGVIANVSMTPDELKKVAYAVPYGSPYHAFPTTVPADQGVKRIEYPKDGNPVDTIKILDPDKNSPTKVIKSPDASALPGIFIKKDLLINPSKPLLMESAFDAEIFDIDITNQTVQSRYLTEKNYYDFNMLADGIPIVVPAYLDVRGKLAPPAMTLDIAGAKVKMTEEEATADPAYGKQDITITAKNGRITSWDITKDGVPYMSSISMSQNTDLLKKFSVSDRGLYVITATGTPLDADAAQITQTKYLRIGGIPAITLDGQHLSGLPTEDWTNLKDSQPTAGLELVTAEAHATTVESLAVTKGAVPYTLFTEDFTLNTASKKTIQLMETGRYMITAKGKDIAIPAVKYVNIDVDRPLPPIVDIANFNGKDIGITLPTESMDQSPIHAEYKVDDGAFSGIMGNSFPLAGNRITMRTVDLAGGDSLKQC